MSWTFILLLLATSAFARKTGGGGGYGRTSHGTSHSYPHSTGYSGSGTGGAHTYPVSTGHSGNNHVPKQTVTHQQNTNYVHKSEVHHHHHYSPPQQIGYGSHSYPVYQAPPPVYVYQYRDSGSRFDNLLTGLALYNLGRMSASHSHYDVNREYRGTPGEICKLGIRKSNGDYEETRVECRLMTSFIWDTSTQPHNVDQHSERKISTTTVVNVTHTTNNNGPNSDTSTVTVTNTTVVSALDSKGESIKVTPEMTCYLIRISRDTSMMKKDIPCALLQTYAQSSWRNACERISPILTMFVFQMFLFQVM